MDADRLDRIERGLRDICSQLELYLEKHGIPLDGDVDSEEPDAFDAFLAEHPELRAPREQLHAGGVADDELVGALREAVRQWDAYYVEQGWPPRSAASSSCVARVLVSGIAHSSTVDAPAELWPNRGEVVSVGRRLARLASAGRVRRVNRPWESTAQWAPGLDA